MSAYDEAVRMLAARALSVAEVETRLARRGHPPPEIESAVRALRERRYLDDAALAYNVGSFLAARRRFGRIRVAAALARRGVPPEAAREALERVYGEIDEESLAFEVAGAAARSAGGSTRSPRAARERLARSLLRRGFPREVVAKVVRTDHDDDDI